jgi:1-deoxy-D-xylulose-5-phosphate reductoisomerase
MQGLPENSLKKIILTASGGPFFGKAKEELKNVTVADALNHPNWSMGRKITIDSATLMNKGFEVIEAVHLFDVTADDIEVLVHRQSIVHSGVELSDGAVIAQLGTPDMRLPIQYALTYPKRWHNDVPRLDLFTTQSLTFEEPDLQRFPNLALSYEAIRRGGNMPCVLNAANEVVNLAFRQGKCGFLQMSDIIAQTMDKVHFVAEPNYEAYVETDGVARRIASEILKL